MAVAASAGRATTSTPVICGSVAPACTASNSVCSAGEGVWWTISSRAMRPRRYRRTPATAPPETKPIASPRAA